jgi:hypothetical protein
MRKIIPAILLISSVIYSGCTANYNFTEDENNKTVKLRNELMNLAIGKKKR